VHTICLNSLLRFMFTRAGSWRVPIHEYASRKYPCRPDLTHVTRVSCVCMYACMYVYIHTHTHIYYIYIYMANIQAHQGRRYACFTGLQESVKGLAMVWAMVWAPAHVPSMIVGIFRLLNVGALNVSLSRKLLHSHNIQCTHRC